MFIEFLTDSGHLFRWSRDVASFGCAMSRYISSLFCSCTVHIATQLVHHAAQCSHSIVDMRGRERESLFICLLFFRSSFRRVCCVRVCKRVLSALQKNHFFFFLFVVFPSSSFSLYLFNVVSCYNFTKSIPKSTGKMMEPKKRIWQTLKVVWKKKEKSVIIKASSQFL